MLWSICYLLVRRVLQLASLRFRSAEFKELEIVVLRHELAVLRRQLVRPELRPADRVFLAASSRTPGFAVHPCEMHAPTPSLDEEHAQPLKPDRLDDRALLPPSPRSGLFRSSRGEVQHGAGGRLAGTVASGAREESFGLR